MYVCMYVCMYVLVKFKQKKEVFNIMTPSHLQVSTANHTSTLKH